MRCTFTCQQGRMCTCNGGGTFIDGNYTPRRYTGPLDDADDFPWSFEVLALLAVFALTVAVVLSVGA